MVYGVSVKCQDIVDKIMCQDIVDIVLTQSNGNSIVNVNI